MLRRPKLQTARRYLARSALALVVPAILLFPAAVRAAPCGNGTATITGFFIDAIRDFTAESNKDISYVVIHYIDGRVVKHKRIETTTYSIDGGAGDEIDFVVVTSGRTTKTFTYSQTNNPPTALLEINTPPVDQSLANCHAFSFGGLACEVASPRTDWTGTSEIPDDGGAESGSFHWVCGAVLACPPTITATIRGTSSSDPDNDIVSWSLDFGDGTIVGGSWSADPPTGVFHDYGPDTTTCSGPLGACVVVLTVTDALGQSDSDTLLMGRVDQTPD